MLFPVGYSGRTMTEEQLVVSSLWRGLDAEFARRVLALMKALGQGDIPYGPGGTLRTSAEQRNLFLARHSLVQSGGCCAFEGKRWALKPGVAHAAPPGSSYHEDVTPEGRCLAVDMVGDHRASEPLLAQHGLVNFRTVNGEPWHLQPSDIPTGRRSFNINTMWPLKPWPLPDTGDDMARIVRLTDAAGRWVAPEQFVMSGAEIEFVTSLERRTAIVNAGAASLDPSGAPWKLRRDQLKFFRLVGDLPSTSIVSPDEFFQG